MTSSLWRARLPPLGLPPQAEDKKGRHSEAARKKGGCWGARAWTSNVQPRTRHNKFRVDQTESKQSQMRNADDRPSRRYVVRSSRGSQSIKQLALPYLVSQTVRSTPRRHSLEFAEMLQALRHKHSQFSFSLIPGLRMLQQLEANSESGCLSESRLQGFLHDYFSNRIAFEVMVGHYCHVTARANAHGGSSSTLGMVGAVQEGSTPEQTVLRACKSAMRICQVGLRQSECMTSSCLCLCTAARV